jgi:hypothetical protein
MMLRAAITLLASAVGWTPVVEHKHHHRHRHHHRRPKPDPPPMQTALASWYAEHGTGACGVGDVQSGYRFASLILPCGARVRFCHGSTSCVTAVMSDHGPYVSGRTFDLNANLRDALSCSDLCWIKWRRA